MSDSPAGGSPALCAVAAAKVNLTLDVGPRRPDGYHPLVTVLQSVALFDELEVRDADDGLHLAVDSEAADPGAGDLGPVDHNLVLIAARALLPLRRGAGSSAGSGAAGAWIRLRKRIPVAAGLAGGSADAAATLLALESLWDLRLEPDELLAVAAGIGSDVPFCIAGGTSVGRGRGELLTPIPVRGSLWWVLGVASSGLSTAAVYERFDELGLGRDLGQAPPATLLDALAAGDLPGIAAGLFNALEPAAFDLRSGLAGDKAAMAEAGALAGLLSGSGPTVLGLCRDEAHARQVADLVGGRFADVRVASGPVPGVTLLHQAPLRGPAPGS